MDWPMNSAVTNALDWQSDFTKSVSLDDNTGSWRDTEPCLEVVNKENWSLNSYGMKKNNCWKIQIWKWFYSSKDGLKAHEPSVMVSAYKPSP